MAHAFRHSGRSRRIEPERRLLRMRLGRRELIRFLDDLIRELQLPVSIFAGNHDMLERRHAPRNLAQCRPQFFRNEQHARAAIGEDVSVLLGGEQRVERHRHHAGTDRAEEHDGEIHRIEHDHRDAFFTPHTETAQQIGEAPALRLQLAVGQVIDGVGKGELVAPPFIHITIEQPGHGVVGIQRPGHTAPSINHSFE